MVPWHHFKELAWSQLPVISDQNSAFILLALHIWRTCWYKDVHHLRRMGTLVTLPAFTV